MKRLLLIPITLLCATFSNAQTIVSNFNTDNDGWTSSGQGGTATWNAGGYVTGIDWNTPVGAGVIPIYWYFNSPGKYNGNKTGYYNGTLSFDIQQTITRPVVQQADVVLYAGTSSLYYFPATPTYPATAPGWSSYSVQLSEVSGLWKTQNSPTGPTAVASDFTFVLGNLLNVEIRGRYGLALSTGSMDNVSLAQFLVTAQPTGSAVCAGTTVTMTSTAAGNPTIGYQWQLFNVATGVATNLTNNAIYSGVNTTTLTINTAAGGAGTYRCHFTGVNANPLNSNTAAVVVNAVPGAPTTTPGAGCAPAASVGLNAAGGTAGQYRWYTVATGGTAIGGQTNSTYTTPTITTTTTYYVSLNNGVCESARTPVIATINALPSLPGVTGALSCTPAALFLQATGASAGQYRWYTVPTGGTPIAGQTNAGYTTPVLSVTTNYYVSIFINPCEGPRSAVAAQISSPPAAPGVTNTSSCVIPSSVNLVASGATNGQYRWYTVGSGGTAIAGQTSNVFATPSISATTTYYVSVNNGTCEGARSAITAILNIPPAAPATTGASGCNPSSVVLNASGGASYNWYDVPTGGLAYGQNTAAFTTPVLSATTTYYAAIWNGTCESARTAAVATLIAPPGAPGATALNRCTAGPVTLKATGATDGSYRWYSTPTGTAIPFEVNSIFVTPDITTSATYYVSIVSGSCESSRTSVNAVISSVCDNPPVITPTTEETQINGTVTITLTDIVSDPDNDIDLSSLSIISPPASGASASIDAQHRLVISYDGLAFSGTDEVTIQVCDTGGLCTTEVIKIEVFGDIQVFNGLSPNGDTRNDKFIIQYIDAIEATKNNHVSIFNRWGDLVWEADNYDNVNQVFTGVATKGTDLPPGSYFYKIEFTSGKKTVTGYLSLKR